MCSLITGSFFCKTEEEQKQLLPMSPFESTMQCFVWLNSFTKFYPLVEKCVNCYWSYSMRAWIFVLKKHQTNAHINQTTSFHFIFYFIPLNHPRTRPIQPYKLNLCSSFFSPLLQCSLYHLLRLLCFSVFVPLQDVLWWKVDKIARI